ncbi:MAG: YesL family protein [Lachnospiraceae bacterium]|nr:YesL family protein [Lachnospiraceae bacterium]MBQ6996737.1 YesL family protein [Lachnospiraceae bacterium]
MFKLDSPLMNFLGKVCDIMILNVLVIVFSIPIFTAGAAITAAYSVAYKMVKNEEGHITKGFFKAFKENFKQSTAIWLIFLAVFFILFFDYRIMFYSEVELNELIQYGVIAVTVILAMGFSFVFPLQARFSNTVKNTIKNSFLMALSHLPSAILFVVSYAVPILAFYFLPQLGPVVLMLACGLLPYAKSFLFLKIFKKYEVMIANNEQEEESTGEGIFAVSDAMEKMSENNKKKK